MKQMNSTLTLNDGTALEGSYVIQNGNTLYLYCYAEITFGDLFALLNDPEKAKKITMDRGGERTVFRGFKELFCIRKEDGNFISAGLRK